MHRVVHFELAAVDPDKSADFYRKTFGWTIQKWEGPQPYWLATTGSEGEMGINGGILQRREGQPHTIMTIAVASVDKALEDVVRNGGQVCMPKFTIPGVGYQAYFQDLDGIVLGVHQWDQSAK